MTTLELLNLDFVRATLVACALLGVLSGVMAPLVVLRQMSFSVHATSELALMGASAALLFGLNVGAGAIAGAVVAALVLAALGLTTAVVVVAVAACWRPLLFASADPEMAAASGVPVRAMAFLFAVLVGVASAQSVQIVGALLVMSLLITPGAAAAQITASPRRAVVYSVVFAELSAVGGMLLSLAPGVPVSVFVAFVSFGIYLVCRGVGRYRNAR